MKLRNVSDIYPLSPLQAGILFKSIYAPDAGFYVSQFTCWLRGELDAAIFRRVWETMLSRHEVLRTAFVWEHLPEPLQVVRQHVELPWTHADCRGLSAGEQQERLAAYRADARRFDPARAPLMRLGLHRLGDDEWQFTWTWHHLLLDGWSMALLMEDVMTGYAAYRQGHQPTWPVRRRFREYIDWLRRQDLSRAEAYWRTALAGFRTPNVLELSGGGGRRDGYGSIDLQLTDAETRSLIDAARREQITLNTLVQGAWALLLSRASGRQDVVYGAVVSGRPPTLPGVEGMLGMFINTLPVRVTVDQAARVGDWLRRLQAHQAEARQHEHTPLVHVQAWSDLPRGSPLFTTIVVFENYGRGRAPLRATNTGLRLQDDEMFTQGEYPIALTVMPGGAWTLRFTWDMNAFDDIQMGRLRAALRVVLLMMSADMGITLRATSRALDEAAAEEARRETALLREARAAALARARRGRAAASELRES